MKRKWLVAAAAAFMGLGALVYVSAEGPPKAEKGTIVGEVIDIVEYGMHGRHGEEHAASGQYRADHGFPVAILEEETGTVWVAVYRLPVPAAGLQTANSVLSPLMGKKVVAQGLLYRAPGINVIRLAIAREY